ncbi:MAG: sulfurtransferase TusA family protein [Planctomycetes bacterium]|nr:sulfurtransferase TusA family protein [Planctomycetota bacterium]
MVKLSEQPVAKTIDVKGQMCPYPIINTKTELPNLKEGEILLVITDNPPTAEETLPRLCEIRKLQLEIIEKMEGDKKSWYCYIKK